MLKEGQKAPDFSLPSSEGDEVQLRAFKGRPVVLYFYPRDDTPGCTREACAFRDDYAKLRKAGAVLLGVSPDSVESHQGFRNKYKLPFPLLADTDKAVAKEYGAFGEKVLYGKKTVGMIRSTFVIDGDGVVRKIFPRVRVDGHSQQVLSALGELVKERPEESGRIRSQGGTAPRTRALRRGAKEAADAEVSGVRSRPR